MSNDETLVETPEQHRGPAVDTVATRRPYEPPRVVSGPAFERVVLMSGCPNVGFSCGPGC